MTDAVQPTRKGWVRRHKILTALGVIVVLIVIGAVAGGGSNKKAPAASVAATSPNPQPSTPTAATQSAVPASVAPVAVAPKTLLDVTGDGIKQTPNFTAADQWTINYSYDCTAFGSKGNFQIYIYNSDGSPSDIAANALDMKGEDVTTEHGGGTFYLQINSECSWHVAVTG